jgi:hypothetical protein
LVVQAEIGVMVAAGETEAPPRLPQSLIQAVEEAMIASAGYAARAAVAMEVSCGEGRGEDLSHASLNLRSSRNPL